ncbi:MAG: hypothetical protein OWV35_02510 [Firmicutes bacterium]|nr:hypothetical protein [Bacillota bacterium]
MAGRRTQPWVWWAALPLLAGCGVPGGRAASEPAGRPPAAAVARPVRSAPSQAAVSAPVGPAQVMDVAMGPWGPLTLQRRRGAGADRWTLRLGRGPGGRVLHRWTMRRHQLRIAGLTGPDVLLLARPLPGTAAEWQLWAVDTRTGFAALAGRWDPAQVTAPPFVAWGGVVVMWNPGTAQATALDLADGATARISGVPSPDDLTAAAGGWPLVDGRPLTLPFLRPPRPALPPGWRWWPVAGWGRQGLALPAGWVPAGHGTFREPRLGGTAVVTIRPAGPGHPHLDAAAGLPPGSVRWLGDHRVELQGRQGPLLTMGVQVQTNAGDRFRLVLSGPPGAAPLFREVLARALIMP